MRTAGGIASFFLFCSFFSAQPSQPEPLSSQRQNSPITQDLSHGATFTVRIAPGLPEFTFKALPHFEQVDDNGDPQSTIREVQVFRGDSRHPVQILNGCSWEAMEPPRVGLEWFRAADINFDGYKDIYILTNWGVTGNQFGCVWLYNTATGSFDFSSAFSQLETMTLHPESKTITTFSNNGNAGNDFHAAKYAVENNRLVLIMQIAQDWDSRRQQFHCVVKQRRGHGPELATLHDVWTAPGENGDGPCDMNGVVHTSTR